LTFKQCITHVKSSDKAAENNKIPEPFAKIPLSNSKELLFWFINETSVVYKLKPKIADAKKKPDKSGSF